MHSDEFATKEEEGKGGIQDEAEQRDDDDVDVRGELPWRDPFDHIREEYFVHSFDLGVSGVVVDVEGADDADSPV